MNKFATDETPLEVSPLMREQLCFRCMVSFCVADLPEWCKTADSELQQTQLLPWSIKPYMDQALKFPPTSGNQVTSWVLAVALEV